MKPHSVRYEFECPDCEQGTIVDPPIQEELLESGCVFCDEDLSETDFDRVSASDA